MPASDQYSLGCTLYELLTGQTPFRGPLEQQLLHHRNTPAPSPRRLVPGLPRDLETICLKCLEKDPARRFPDCQALADDLRRFLDGEPTLARPLGMAERLRRWLRREPRLAAALLTAAAALLAVAVVLGLSSEQQRDLNTQLGKTVAQLESETRDKTDALAQGQAGTAEKTKALDLVRVESRQKAAALKQSEQALGEARLQKQHAEERFDLSECKRHAANLSLAQAAWKDSDTPLAHTYLDRCRWDLRGWEHDLVSSLFRQQQRTFYGHTGAVEDVAFSPDGRHLASASDYDVELEAQVLAGSGEIGVFLRTLPRHLFAAFGGWGNRHHGLLSARPGGHAQESPLADGGLQPGRWYRLRLEVRGERIRVFLDGRQLYETRVDGLPRGGIGLRTRDTAARFRALRVTDPEGRVLLDGLPRPLAGPS